MKITVIGDIHGRKIWKDIVKIESDSDKFIFLGDYFDPYEDISVDDMISNFKNIIEFKKSNNVELLTGNHDLHYISNNLVPCCRFSNEVNKKIHLYIKSLIETDILKLTYYDIDTWFSHAGFTNTWLRDNRLKLDSVELNNHFKQQCLSKPQSYQFKYRDSRTSLYGDDVFQSPLWVRPYSLKIDCPIDTFQIIGHTQFNHMEEFPNPFKYMQCDSLEWNKYYVISDLKIITKTIDYDN